MAVDLSQLPSPDIIESLEFEAILAERKAFFISLHPVEQQADVAALLELESEPIVKLLEENAYREMLLRSRYNDEARSLLLAYASGTELDHIAATYYQLPRLVITPANPDADPPVAEVRESDDALRYRCALKPESFSCAGPTQAFEFWALSADGRVKSAKADSPTGGTTRVTVLAHDNPAVEDDIGVPTEELLDTVRAALNAEVIRPLSEELVVQAAQVITYDVVYDVTLYRGAAGEAALDAAQKALEKLTSEGNVLGFDVTKSQLDGAAQKTGIKRAVRVSPVEEILCDDTQAPRCTSITLNVVGVEP